MGDDTTYDPGEDPVQIAGRALYGHARGLYGDDLKRSWDAASIGARLPYTDRAVAVIDALTE